MKHETFDGGWLDLREPHEITIKHRRKVGVFFSSLSSAMQRMEDAQKLELAKLNLPEGEQPTEEQRAEAIKEAKADPPLTDDELDRMLQLEQVALVVAIARWSLGKPVSLETFDEMTEVEYAPILAVAKPYADAVMAGMRIKTDEPESLVPNETDPTGDSSD